MSQHIHKHSFPILLMAFGVLLISVLDFGRYSALTDPSAFRAGLMGDISRIHPTSTGLAAITPPKVSAPMKPATSTVQSSTMQAVVDTAGEQTQLDVNLQPRSKN